MQHEGELIAFLRSVFDGALGDAFFDDGASLPAVRTPEHERVVTADVVVEEVHFSFALSPPASAGHRAIVQNVSDLAAMAALPVGFVWSLAIPPHLTVSSSPEGCPVAASLEWFLRGAAAAAKAYGLPLFGGDLSSTTGPLVCSVTAFGDAARPHPQRRGGRPTDRLFVGKPLGGSAHGLRALLGGAAQEGPLASCIAAHQWPTAQVELGQALAVDATALMDLSDGLALDLHRLLEASSCGAQFVPEWTAAIAPGATPEDALYGGEDYALLFALPASTSPARVAELAAIAAKDGALFEIGTLTEGPPQLQASDGHPIARRGFDHFRGPA